MGFPCFKASSHPWLATTAISLCLASGGVILGSSLSAGMGPGKTAGGQIPIAELGWSQPPTETISYGIWGRRRGPSSGKARKGMLPPLPVDGACRDSSSSIPRPSAQPQHGGDPVGTRFSPNTLHCLTGQCWVQGVSAAEPIWLSSSPKTACWQKQLRQPTAPAAHMHGLIGTSEPRAPAHAADAPCP